MTLGSDVLRSIPPSATTTASSCSCPASSPIPTTSRRAPPPRSFPFTAAAATKAASIDGLNIGTPRWRQSAAGIHRRTSATPRRSAFTTSGGLGESETAGVVMNVVPRTGGNRVSGAVFFSGTGEGLQSSNYTEELRLAGLTAAIPLSKVYDLNGAVGGPIMRDRVWYFVNARTQGSHARDRERVLQPELRRRSQVALLTGPQPAGVLRPHGRTSAGASRGRPHLATRSASTGTSSGSAATARA